MSGKPTDKPPRRGKPIGPTRAPSRPLFTDRDMGPDSSTAVRSVPGGDDAPTQLRAETPAPIRHVGAERAPDARGEDSPNETLMIPQRPDIPGSPRAIPSQPMAFSPPYPEPRRHAYPSQPPGPRPSQFPPQAHPSQFAPQAHPSQFPPQGHPSQFPPQAHPSQIPPQAHPSQIPPQAWESTTGPPMPAHARPAQSYPGSHPPPDAPSYSQPPAAPPAAPSSPSAATRRRSPMLTDDAPPSSTRGAGPGSFSRIFLGSVEKYRGKTGNVGSASQEAATALAQAADPTQPRVTAPTLRLRSRLALIEALALTLLLPSIGWLADHDDPFFLNHHFSWIFAAPLLLGLRHGFAPALASAVVLDGLIAAAWRTQFVPMQQLPGETMVGIAAFAMITGQFSDVWKRELVRLDGGFSVLRKQLGEVMRAHFLLELSHDRLEERMGKGTPNLRDALVAVHRSVALRPGTSLADLSDAIVDIFSMYTMVEVGAVYRVEDDRLVPDPVATIGRPAQLDPRDEQVKEALRTKKLTYIRGGASVEAGTERTKLLAVVPFVDVRQKLHGMLLVESIPLLAFERRNLEALAILGGRFADAVASGGGDVGVQRGQKKELSIRLRRSIRDLIENDVASTLFVLLVRKGGAASDSIETMLGGTLRALDFPYVERDAEGNYIVYILLPLTDEAGARSFGARIERIVRREGSMSLARAGGFSFHHVLRPNDTAEGVMSTLGAKAKLDEASVEHTIIV